MNLPEGLSVDEFERDLSILLERLKESSDKKTYKKLKVLRDRLVSLHKDNLVKINHSVLELICARHLILRGYKADVECLLDGLSCDLFGGRGLGTLLVEVETGFIPPEHALDPLNYCRARIASKIARYSGYANKFCLGTPPHYIIQIPPPLTKPPRYRTEEDMKEVKSLCDLYYTNPPVSLEEVRNARLHAIYILDADKATVHEIDLETYSEKAEARALNSNYP